MKRLLVLFSAALRPGSNPKPYKHLIIFSPHKSLTQRSRENVRVFPWSCVTCQWRFTSGGVSCSPHWPAVCQTRLCYQQSSLQYSLSPFSLSAFHNHLSWFPVSTASCHRADLTQTRVLCHQHIDFTLWRVCVGSFRSFFFAIRNISPERNHRTRMFVDVSSARKTLRAVYSGLWDIDEIKRRN